MKYKIFLTDNIMTLENEECIGEANTYQEVCQLLREELQARGIRQEPYWRFLLYPTATSIDFGNWFKFAAVVPPIPAKVITGEEDS